jgi:hypothetical protein
MDTQLQVIDDFCHKHEIPENGKLELIEIFKNSFIHVAMGIMGMPGVAEKVKTKKKKGEKKLCLGITKAGNKCKKSSQENKDYCKLHEPSNNKKGKLTQPEGSKFHYCFRHKKNYKKYEGDDVSSSEDEGAVASKKVLSELTDEQKKEMIANGYDNQEDYLTAVDLFEKNKKKVTKGMEEDDIKKFDEDNTIVDKSDGSDGSDNDTKDESKDESKVAVKQRRPRIRNKGV